MNGLLISIFLTASNLAGAADIPAALPKDVWSFSAEDYVTSCSPSRLSSLTSTIDREDPRAKATLDALIQRFTFCTGFTVGITEVVQALGTARVLPGGCGMESMSYEIAHSTASVYWFKNKTEMKSYRASTLLVTSLVNAFPCSAPSAK